MFFYGRVSVIQMTSPNSLKILFSPNFFANFKGSRNYETASNQIRTSLMKYGSKEAAFSIQRSSLTKGLIALENNPFLQVSNPNTRCDCTKFVQRRTKFRGAVDYHLRSKPNRHKSWKTIDECWGKAFVSGIWLISHAICPENSENNS
mgnify:CR=1 FL=1